MAQRLLEEPHRSGAAVFKILYRILVAISAIIVVLFVAYKIAVKPPEIAPEVTPTPAITVPDAEDNAEPTPTPIVMERRDNVYTFLLAAQDQSSGNSDTIMVVTYDVAAQSVGVVSIPRDTMVDLDYPKINYAYASGGISTLKDTVSSLLGIPIDYYITVNMQAFVSIVNAVGGIEFYVPLDMDYDDPTQDLYIHYSAGWQYLTGQQALEVARFRQNNDGTGYYNSDLGRIDTQQSMLTTLAKKVLSWNSITKIGDFLDIFSSYVGTDLSFTNMLWFGEQALGVDLQNNVAFTTLPGDGSVTYNGTAWCYELYPDECLELINTYLNPYTTDLTLDQLNILQAP